MWISPEEKRFLNPEPKNSPNGLEQPQGYKKLEQRLIKKNLSSYKIINDQTKDGVDVAIEAVGIPETFDICQNIIRPGGHIANVGVHGKSVDLQLQKLWIKNITITTGLVNTNTTSLLLKTVVSKKLQPEKLITHRFTFDQMMEAYEVFSNAVREKTMKVIISNT